MKNRFIRYFEIAGVSFSIESPWEIEKREPFSFFEVSPREADAEYTVSEEEALPPVAGEQVLENSNYRTYINGSEIQRRAGFYSGGKILSPEYAVTVFRKGDFKKPHIVFSRENKVPENDAMIFKTLFLEHLLLTGGALILHSSYIVTEWGAVLFTAPSGTGKSTQAELWARHREADIINGDCSAFGKKDGVYKAYGIPFSGSSNICRNVTTPIAAVVSLGQAPENSIKRLGGAAAFRAVLEGIKVDMRDAGEMSAAVEAARAAASEIPVFRLDCTPDIGAVTTLENELKKLG